MEAFISSTSGTAGLLSIPMAHQLIGFYTVADSADGCLKVLRSYQYQRGERHLRPWCAPAIGNEPVPSGTPGRPGGYVWHTTGSGKTMTSFKAAQLIAGSQDADKVVFLMDRVELGTQSLLEYRSRSRTSADGCARHGEHRTCCGIETRQAPTPTTP